MITTSKCSVEDVRCLLRGASAREAKVLHYAPERTGLPRFVEGVISRNGRFATGTDECVRPYTSKAENCSYLAALATFTPLEDVA